MKRLPLVIILVWTLAAASTAFAAERVWLDELDLSTFTSGWGKAQARKSVGGAPLTIEGQKFEHGVGTHAQAQYILDLGGKGVRFSAMVGVDDDVSDPAASVEFMVCGDGKELARSDVMKVSDKARKLEANLQGVKTLTLLTADAGDGIRFDHADWADASIEMADGTKPKPAEEPETRWRLGEKGDIVWDVRKDTFLPHEDHIEMSGRRVSGIVRYGVDAQGCLTLKRKMVWPMLRTIPNDTHASLVREFGPETEPKILVDGKPVASEKPYEMTLDGLLTIRSATPEGLDIERRILPSVGKPMLIERIVFRNTSDRTLRLSVTPPSVQVKTDAAKGQYGVYHLETLFTGKTELTLEPKATAECAVAINGRREDAEAQASGHACTSFEAALEETKRREFLASLADKLILETPDPILNRAFAFAKIRAAESIYATKGGLMHGPGGGTYYAAIWANDQAEYANPFFAFLGDKGGVESALTSYRMFARYMNPEYKPIPSSIVAEGDSFWNGAGDRGDQAMIAYGASRFCLANGDRKTAETLWPLIEWCLEYLKRKTNADGVIASDSDELENRFPAGKANLCTAALAYDALRSAEALGRDLGKDEKLLQSYAERADALRQAIEQFFGAKVEGFDTYRYYQENDVLRAWICVPLTVGIFDRQAETIRALFSERLWTKDGLATQAGKPDFWDRSTLYALRGVLAAGALKEGMEHLQAYSQRRLLGGHVPYAVEAYPEGGQRHLSAESALYCRVYTEGLFGIRPIGLSAFECAPRLPEGWDTMALRKVHAFGTTFDLVVKRVKDTTENKLELSVTQGEKVLKKTTFASGETVKVRLTEK
ncbi:MAG TPA: NPCBM/NEW2 domain-containing protein [Candidatus Sumerlaeota bacterium]|nr:NPCBM/NEW2 domain-containing protein [Candidatus Sumerlaeota bacterium]